MKACTVTEFENVELRHDRDPPRARGLSLRDLSRGADDPQANIMPFERNESGIWRASRWIGTFQHEGVDYTIIPRIGMKLFGRIAVEAISVALLPEGAGPNRSKPHGLLDVLRSSGVWRCAAPAAGKAFLGFTWSAVRPTA